MRAGAEARAKDGARSGGEALSVPAEALPEHVSQHVDTVAALHARAESGVGVHQRVVEAVTSNLGRPLFLNLTLAALALWMLVNVFPHPFGVRQFDPPPFFWLQGGVGLGALLLTIVILITQNRQARAAERRAQLDLQVSLLTEQKIAKLIALVEELRRDMPSVQNRTDPVAAAMAEATDPHAILDALEDKLDDAVELVEEAQEQV